MQHVKCFKLFIYMVNLPWLTLPPVFVHRQDRIATKNVCLAKHFTRTNIILHRHACGASDDSMSGQITDVEYQMSYIRIQISDLTRYIADVRVICQTTHVRCQLWNFNVSTKGTVEWGRCNYNATMDSELMKHTIAKQMNTRDNWRAVS